METVRINIRKFKSYEYLFYALYFLILGFFCRAYSPTNPDAVNSLMPFLIALGLYFIAKFILQAAKLARHLLFRYAFFLLFIALIYKAVSGLFLMTAIGIGTLFIVLPSVGEVIVLAAILSVCLLILVSSLRRFRAYRQMSRVILATVLFTATISYVVICGILWRPPDLKRCESVVQPGIVDRLTPPEFAKNLSYPYELLYLPKKQLLCATFKMAGNLVLYIWDNPSANKLVVIDLSNEEQPRLESFSMEGELMPEYMTHDAKRDELLVTGVGYREVAIDFISLKNFPKLEQIRSEKINFEPNSIALYPDRDLLAVFKIPQDLMVYDYSTMKLIHEADIKNAYFSSKTARRGLIINRLCFLTVANVWQSPDLSHLYVDATGKEVAEIGLNNNYKMRFADVPWGGGNILGVLENRTLYQVDVSWGKLNIIDMDKMKLIRRVKLGYKSRAIQADFKRDLLMIGDWFKGEVNLYRLSTLGRLHPPIPVGPYLRDLAYDSEHGLLFAGSKCGVYQINIEKLINAQLSKTR